MSGGAAANRAARRKPSASSATRGSPSGEVTITHLRPDASGQRGAGLARHIWVTVKLAVRVMIGRSGTLIMITADMIMVGRAGVRELAYYGLAYGATQMLVVIRLGAMTGTTVLASQADGMGDAKQCGAVWKVGLAYALAMGVVFAALCVLGERFLLLGSDRGGRS